MLNAHVVDVTVCHPMGLPFSTEVFVLPDAGGTVAKSWWWNSSRRIALYWKRLSHQGEIPSLGRGYPINGWFTRQNACLEVGQLRSAVPPSELPGGSPESFVETALWPNFFRTSLTPTPTPETLPCVFPACYLFWVCSWRTDLSQLGTVLRASYAFSLLTLRTTFWDEHCFSRTHFTMKAKTKWSHLSKVTYSQEVQSWALSPWFALQPVLTLAPHTSQVPAREVTQTQPLEDLASPHI